MGRIALQLGSKLAASEHRLRAESKAKGELRAKRVETLLSALGLCRVSWVSLSGEFPLLCALHEERHWSSYPSPVSFRDTVIPYAPLYLISSFLPISLQSFLNHFL